MDETYIQLKERILNGFPDHKNQLPRVLRQYWQEHQVLSIEDDFILCGYRLFIPITMCRKIFAYLYLVHQGITPTKQRTCLILYLPRIDKDLEIITSCTQCQDHLPSNHMEPLQAKIRPIHPFQEAATDF